MVVSHEIKVSNESSEVVMYCEQDENEMMDEVVYQIDNHLIDVFCGDVSH